MHLELLPIKIILEAEFDYINPYVKARINDNLIFSDHLKAQQTTIYTVQKLELYQSHQITIERSGKSDDCSEQMCKIIDLEIDGASIRDLVYHTSMFFPEYPEPWASEQNQNGKPLEYPVLGETVFGHNGIWTFNFSTPFFRFMINKVKGQ